MSVKTVYWGSSKFPNLKSFQIRITWALFPPPPTCGVVLAELMEELAIQSWELDRGGRVSPEVAQHLQVQRAQLSEKQWMWNLGWIFFIIDWTRRIWTWGRCTCWPGGCRCWRPPWWGWGEGSVPTPSAKSWTRPPSTSGSPPSSSSRFDLHKAAFR